MRLRLLVSGRVPVLVGVCLSDAGDGVEVDDGGEGRGEHYAFDFGLKFRGLDEVLRAGDSGNKQVFLVILYSAIQ